MQGLIQSPTIHLSEDAQREPHIYTVLIKDQAELHQVMECLDECKVMCKPGSIVSDWFSELVPVNCNEPLRAPHSDFENTTFS